MVATLRSVNIGLPKDVPWDGRTVHTGIWKRSVPGPHLVRRLNIDGDGQGDLAGHGGEQRAVLVYQMDSYLHWQKHLGRDDFEFGQFGENFTVDGMSDEDVCVGDRYRIGTAEFEVTQPRVTCFRVGMRMGEPELPALLVAHHRPGFYLRVLAEGQVQAGDEIVRTRVGPHAISVSDIDALLYLPHRDLDQLRAAVDIAALSPGWQQSFRELLVGAPSQAPGWQGFRRLRVTDLVAENPSVLSVYLAAEDGESLPLPVAGQYLTVRVPDTGVRNYSLSAGPDAQTYRISVKREPHGAMSGWLHAHLRRDSVLDVAAPRGDFVLIDGDGPVLLVSAGIGITPVLAMLHALAAMQSCRDVWWVHVAHDAAHQAFADEAHRLLHSLPNAHEHIVFTAADGRPSAATIAALALPTDATAYLCGPMAFMDDLRRLLTDVGIASDRIYTEQFAGRSAINPGVVADAPVAPHQPPGLLGTGPEITFARSGLTTRWSPQHRSLLELAEACDVPTRWSCRTGVCHTCLTSRLSGDVAYSPTPLEPPPAGSTLLCCAQPTSDLVLDL